MAICSSPQTGAVTGRNAVGLAGLEVRTMTGRDVHLLDQPRRVHIDEYTLLLLAPRFKDKEKTNKRYGVTPKKNRRALERKL